MITGVAVIPLSSQAEASKAIVQAKRSFKEEGETESATAGVGYSSSSDDNEIDDGPDDLSAAVSPDPESYPQQGVDGHGPEDSNVVEDVIGRRGLYGRFATRWFSRNGWERRNRKSQGMSGNSPDDGHPVPARRHRLDSWMNEPMELEELSKAGMKFPDSVGSQQVDAGTRARTDAASAPQPEQEAGEDPNRQCSAWLVAQRSCSSQAPSRRYDPDQVRRVCSQPSNCSAPRPGMPATLAVAARCRCRWLVLAR